LKTLLIGLCIVSSLFFLCCYSIRNKEVQQSARNNPVHITSAQYFFNTIHFVVEPTPTDKPDVKYKFIITSPTWALTEWVSWSQLQLNIQLDKIVVARVSKNEMIAFANQPFTITAVYAQQKEHSIIFLLYSVFFLTMATAIIIIHQCIAIDSFILKFPYWLVRLSKFSKEAR